VERTLTKLGIEVIDFQDWPGFEQSDFQVSEEYLTKIMEFREGSQQETEDIQSDQAIDKHRKAEPEGEALVIVKRERNGDYYITSQRGEQTPSWFISQTSILNTVDKGPRITWQPEAFLRFTSTLSFAADGHSSDHAFEALLWGLAQSGLSLLDEKTIQSVFGGAIDQAQINIEQERQLYEDTLEKKYGESLDQVMARLSPSNRPWAALQLANEMAQSLARQHRLAQASAAREKKRAELAEKQLREVERFRRKMEDKRQRGQRKAKKNKAKGKKR